MNASAVPILMYHHVGPKPGLVTLSPETFIEQMTWLARSGWKTVTAADLEGFYQGEALPRKSVMITFDDGYLDNWVYAFPVLERLGLHAHIFLITGQIGDGPVRTLSEIAFSHKECEARIAEGHADEVMMRWSEVEAMRASGLIEFHAHTHTHQRWDLMQPDVILRHQALADDIRRCRETLTAKLGNCSRHFCWPQGFYNPEYAAIAQAQGFDFLYTTERRMNRPDNLSWRMGRISTKEREDTAWLKRRLFMYTTPVVSSIFALHKGPRYT